MSCENDEAVLRLEYRPVKKGAERVIVPPTRGECIGFGIFVLLTVGLFVMSAVWWAWAAVI